MPRKPKPIRSLIVVPRPPGSTGRKCSVCSHERVRKINAMILKGDSFRRISSHFGMSDRSVGRHAEKCLNLEIRALIKEKKIERAIDHYEEIRKLLDFALELKDAAREMLYCDELERISFVPRASEIDVIYDDLTDLCPATGRPLRKTRDLQSIINRLSGIPEIKNVRAVVSEKDMKDYALRAIAAADIVLDKVAKVQGLYDKEGANMKTLDEVVSAFKAWLDDNPSTTEKEKTVWLERFAKRGGVEIKQLAVRVGVSVQEINQVQ